ncbi:hypothetical protein LTR53_006071 [Teratosphaeriaceae sp. CCFEE 6253]|nr:hypothetical protein LTR53_006071 [Teratosphaeriaceae sp. CCFEE 6253]
MLGASLRPRPRGASQERRMFGAHARVYSKDEELGKRDDDFRRPKRGSLAASLGEPGRWRKRRILVVVALLVLGYVGLRSLLPGGLGAIEQSIGMTGSGWEVDGSVGRNVEPDGPPPKLKSVGSEGESKRYYEGLIKFYRLASSLHSITTTMGIRPQNRNILFAVSSLQSAASLMPMACEMAKWDRNYVHMAFLGRDSLPVDEILEVNGVSRDDCTVYFHDGRADYSEYSTDKRAEVAVAGAMKHINDFMHPQAMIMDDSAVEEAFFVRAMRGKAAEMGRTLIEIPAGRYEDFLWMMRLDSGSLSNWFKPTIDILIHALPDSSGGLIRLVKSLERADYTGLPIPKLTIELPSDIEHFTKSSDDPWRSSTLSLHHRIPASHMSSEQASVRFVESFFPSHTEDHHVLVLSPQAEISPLYLQYLHYVLLEYKYSSYTSPESDKLLGISLDVPTIFLNGSGVLEQPWVRVEEALAPQHDTSEQAGKKTSPAPFLYQAPSATASLIFGDKWATLHDFLANRLASSHSGAAQRTKKLVSETEPAWLEYLLELMRARGWSMLHPSQPFVTVHNELSQIPEEYLHDKNERKEVELSKDPARLAEEPFLLAVEMPAHAEHVEREVPHRQPLQEMLAFNGDMPDVSQLPFLSHAGELISSISQRIELVEEYVPLFRRRIGGCMGEDATRRRVAGDAGSTRDLFCLPGDEVEFDTDGEVDYEEIAHGVIAATAIPDEDAEEGVKAVVAGMRASAAADPDGSEVEGSSKG